MLAPATTLTNQYKSETTAKIEQAIKEEVVPIAFNSAWYRDHIEDYRHSIDPVVWTRFAGVMHEFLSRGGKRLRPVLTCLTHDALGGESEEIYKFAAIPEVIHSGTLMVDDVEDRSAKRRGRKAIHKLHGIPMAIAYGNLLYYLPTEVIRVSSLPELDKGRMYAMLTHEMNLLHIGQTLDVTWGEDKRYDVTLDQYRQMIEYKTGVLAAMAIGIGAIVAGATTEQQQKLREIAIATGKAFQVTDDVMNLTPNLGKTLGEDITEGKITYLVAYTMERVDERTKRELTNILKGRFKTRRKINRAIAIMTAAGALDQGREYARRLIREAKTSLDDVLEDSEHKEIYMDILDSAVNREN